VRSKRGELEKVGVEIDSGSWREGGWEELEKVGVEIDSGS